MSAICQVVVNCIFNPEILEEADEERALIAKDLRLVLLYEHQEATWIQPRGHLVLGTKALSRWMKPLFEVRA